MSENELNPAAILFPCKHYQGSWSIVNMTTTRTILECRCICGENTFRAEIISDNRK